MRLSRGRAAAGAICALLVSACAGPRIPRQDSAEYIRSGGLHAINAVSAYRQGATGRGVMIGLVDCGLRGAQKELRRNMSPLSTDVIAAQRVADLGDRHGDFVAGPLGSAYDGRGLLGVAYNATLLSVRADFDGGSRGECAFRPSDLARALDYAVEHGAQVIVLPVEGKRPFGAPFEQALTHAVAAGAVVVIAAGNESAAEPSWPARYAADPRFAASVIVVGAGRMDGSVTGWTNRAGATRGRYLIAPGEAVITDCGRKWCKRISGTSMSASYVAGAMALLIEAHPGLAGPVLAQRLLDAAQDIGDPGVDAVYGRGWLDIGKAFAPPPRTG